MPFTGKLGTSDSYLANIEFGFGAVVVPFNIFSGLYILVPGKTNDTLYSNINNPQVEKEIVAIPNPFLETGLFGD